MDELIKRLERANEYEPLGNDGWEAAAALSEAQATIARLEAALREIAEDVGNLGDDLTYLPDATRFNLHENAYNIGKAAFAALSPREGEGT